MFVYLICLIQYRVGEMEMVGKREPRGKRKTGEERTREERVFENLWKWYKIGSEKVATKSMFYWKMYNIEKSLYFTQKVCKN